MNNATIKRKKIYSTLLKLKLKKYKKKEGEGEEKKEDMKRSTILFKKWGQNQWLTIK